MTPQDLCKSGSEFGEQSALFCWANSAATRKRFPMLYRASDGRCKLYSINNNAGVGSGEDAGKTAAIRGGRAKQIGLTPGVADIFLPLGRHGMNGLYIELKIDPQHPVNLKAKKKNKASANQIAFGDQVISDGFGWVCCEGWESAVAVLTQYLS